MLRFGPTLEAALCMIDKNGLEAMPARLRSGSNAGMFCTFRHGFHLNSWLFLPVSRCFHFLPTECGLLTAGFLKQCVCQDFTNCRCLMVFLCCQALAQDAGAHGQRSSQALKFSLLPELFDALWPFRSCKRICMSSIFPQAQTDSFPNLISIFAH
jgi:hypothetical protein